MKVAEQLTELLRLVQNTAADEIDCDEFLARVAAYLEALGPEDDKVEGFEALSQHLDVCGECHEEFEALLAVFGESRS